MISVIIPTYKGAEFLPRAIDSVLRQEDVSFEIIVVDDNPPESEERRQTESVMQLYSNIQKIIYLKHPRNLNGSAARNTGLKVSNGAYISFLDDDDIYLPFRLAKCQEIINKSSADMVYTDVIVTKNNVLTSYVEAKTEGNLFKELWLNENLFGTGSNIFIKKNAILENGSFNETLVRQQDFEFLLRQFSKGIKATNINECLVIKAMNGTNNSASYDRLKKIKEILLGEFESELDKMGADGKRTILIAQHLELLHSAAVERHHDGLRTEQSALRKLGYHFTVKDNIKYKLLSQSVGKQIQQVVWYMKSKGILLQHPEYRKYLKML